MLRRECLAVWFLWLLLPASLQGQLVPVGGEFMVNEFTTDGQLVPAIGAAADGTFLVAWTDYFDPDGYCVRLVTRRFDGGGVAQGGEGEIAERGYDIAVAGGADNFVVVWDRSGDILGVRVDSAGAAVGDEFSVNTFTTGIQVGPDVAMDAGGGFVVVWEQANLDFTREVWARRFDSVANPLGGQFRVQMETSRQYAYPVVAAGSDGRFTVAWARRAEEGGSSIAARGYDSSGAPLGEPVRVDSSGGSAPGVSLAHDGSSVIVWTGDDGDGFGVFARRYDSDGAALGDPFQVNTYTSYQQSLEHVFFGIPRSQPVAHNDRGDFLIAWASNYQDGSDYGVFGRRYSSEGVADGAEIQLSTYTTDVQHVPQVAGVGEDFVVIWESYAQDGESYGVFGRRFGIAPTPTAGSPPPTATATDTPSPTSTAVPTEPPGTATPTPCIGDCNGDGSIRVDELIRGVNIAIGVLPVANCRPFDADGDGTVSISELVRAVNVALTGCVAAG